MDNMEQLKNDLNHEEDAVSATAPRHRHRKNHRAGVKERARKEKKALAASTPSTPISASHPGSTGGKKHSHRAGVKYRAKKEALKKMATEGTPATYDADGNIQDDGHQIEHSDDEANDAEHDTPSLTYDSDRHSEDHEDTSSEHEVEPDVFTAAPINATSDSAISVLNGDESYSYEAKANMSGETVEKSTEKVSATTTTLPIEVENSKSPIPQTKPTTPQRRKSIVILSLARPLVL
ncbi:hypothetical protein BP5796_12711 [Coleophoma crateriformis]|uniref:Uncharacterized protein n=1 Tax=Coleophoma crateriformis TaxID=565419 RepID=A0A3D8Q622_9HELO|nr:hypothetical protein BP5796_12711 [Coleophoma crateriformis]